MRRVVAGLCSGLGGGLRVTRHDVPWRGLPRPMRVVHITDVHVGWTTPPALLARVVELTRRLSPALVALTGDYINYDLSQVARLHAFVSRLPRPVFATLGNHDHWYGRDGVKDALRRAGAIVLQNESVVLEHEGQTLPIVGVDDERSGHADVSRAFSCLRGGALPLVLTHFPGVAERIAEQSAPLILAGHTHGGQIDIPLITRPLLKAAGLEYLAGWFELGESKLYVSSGIGVSVDGLRGGRSSIPEVAVFELVPADWRSPRPSVQARFLGLRVRRISAEDDAYRRVVELLEGDASDA